MTYQALYRVWRPQRFDEVVGQQVVTQTLKNAIITKHISHAYLFAGPRGTGKTSAAKIFAKAVNCHHQVDGEPCNQCATCKAITEGRLNDVIEIDAASNNGVEEIRNIRDKAKYAPTQADYKVYIIDEVHMLSTGAFNALLKTLEEPPANVIFILATTEPHKIPLTIISRVQRFDFRRIAAEDARSRMKEILDDKQVEYDDQALWVIANAAEGGMRDALSILDQALSFGDERLTVADALLVTGSVKKQLLMDYFLQVAAQQTASALTTLTKLLAAGKDGQRFIEDLISFLRDVLLYQESPKLVAVESTGLSAADFEKLVAAAPPVALYQMIDTLNEVQTQMRFTTHPDVYLEVLTVRLAQPVPTVSAGPNPAVVKDLQDQVAKLQKQLASFKATGAPAPKVTSRPQKPSGSRGPRINRTQVNEVLGTATRQDLENLKELWGDMLSLMDKATGSLINTSEPVAAGPGGVVVSFDDAILFEQASDGDLAQTMEQALQQLTGSKRRVTFVPKAKWPQMRHEYLARHGFLKRPAAEKPEKPAADPVVTAAQQLFGADAVEVKND